MSDGASDRTTDGEAPAPMPSEPTPEALAAQAQRDRAERFAAVLRASVPARQRPARLRLALERYAGDEGKREACAAAEAFAAAGFVAERGAERHAMLLTGAFGVGKTWLGTAIWKELVWRQVTGSGALARDLARFTWTVFDDLVRDVQGCYHPSSERTATAALESYRAADVLLVDDVGDLDAPGAESDDRRRILYAVLNHRSNWLLPTILTSNLSPSELEAAFGGRSVQRVVEMCSMVGMGGANLRYGL